MNSGSGGLWGKWDLSYELKIRVNDNKMRRIYCRTGDSMIIIIIMFHS